MFDAQAIEKKIGYSFRDKTLLKKAFTHKSYVNVHGGEDNDRMEYLGDAVLQLIVSEEQYLAGGKKSSGEMTSERQKIVSKEPLKKAVEEMGIMEHLLIEGGEANIGAKTVSDLYECLVAAIYFDGGYEAAKEFFQRNRPPESKQENYIGELQERLKTKLEYPYEKKGPDNSPEFFVTVTANGMTGKGPGKSKRAAEQAAAKALLEKLKGMDKQL